MIYGALSLSAVSSYAVDKISKFEVLPEKTLMTQLVFNKIEDEKTGIRLDKSEIVKTNLSEDAQYGLDNINWRRIGQDEILFWGSIYKKRESVRIFKIDKIHTKPQISYLCTLKTDELSEILDNLLLNDHKLNCHELYFSIDKITRKGKGFEGVMTVMGEIDNDWHSFSYAFSADEHGAMSNLKNIKRDINALNKEDPAGDVKDATALMLSDPLTPSSFIVNTIQLEDDNSQKCFVYVRYSTTILDKNNVTRSCSNNEIYQILPSQSVLDSALQIHGKLKKTIFSHFINNKDGRVENEFLEGTAKFEFSDGFVLIIPYIIDRKGNLKLTER